MNRSGHLVDAGARQPPLKRGLNVCTLGVAFTQYDKPNEMRISPSQHARTQHEQLGASVLAADIAKVTLVTLSGHGADRNI